MLEEDTKYLLFHHSHSCLNRANMFFTLIFIAVLFPRSQSVMPALKVDGDLNIALLLENCRNVSEIIPFAQQSLVSTALWTIERVNFLENLSLMKLGLEIYETCSESDYFKTVFDLYEDNDTYTLGTVTEKKLKQKLLRFSDLLDIRTIVVTPLNSLLIKAAVKFLSALGWTDNVTILAPEDSFMREFYKLSKAEFVCVKDCIVYENTCPNLPNSSIPFVFFGNFQQIEEFVNAQEIFGTGEEVDGLFVPLDGSVPKVLPFKSFVVIPPHNPSSRAFNTEEKILPSPQFLYTAKAILTYTKNIEHFIENNCNETVYKLNCLRNKFNKKYRPVIMSPNSILESLKIEPLRFHFVYDIYRVENGTTDLSELVMKNNFFQPLSKIFAYSIFNHNLTLVNPDFEERVNISIVSENVQLKCVNFYYEKHFNFFVGTVSSLSFKTEAWVYAFLSLSLLGVIFCMAILIFLLASICRREILEGNPILTISLLVSIMILFCSVLPFSLEDNKDTINLLCLTKSLSITLGYAFVFSLLLSRCILLATASKEIGFMSHIAGPVQAFLCLFIFGVQAALSLQLIGKCVEVYSSPSFIYLMSYNVMLLLLLLCLCPLIYRCERNYREGKYFSFAVILTNIIWCIWLPLYMTLERSWNEPMLCLGLVATGGIFLGSIFIPRTYLMTIAAARNKITSNLPSLQTGNSIVDIYRTHTQPIYDCVNVAAINAVNVARAGVTIPSTTTMQQPDLYSCPALPEDEDLDFRCDTPSHNNKITRF